METVTVSPKYQVVIPRTIRDSLGIRPGQKVQVIRYGDRIELIPLRPVQETHGDCSERRQAFCGIEAADGGQCDAGNGESTQCNAMDTGRRLLVIRRKPGAKVGRNPPSST